jgi:hypothetical protein
MDGIDKIIIALPGQKQLEEADHEGLTKDEIVKILTVIKAIQDAEGIGMPYGTAKRVAMVYQELKELLSENGVKI